MSASNAPEERVIDAATGGQKGTKGIRWSLLPWDELAEVARHYAVGAKKYAPWNWRRGYDWHLSADSLMNHFTAFWYDREWLDPETGTPHLAAVVFHALALMFFHKHFPEKDDRPPKVLPPPEPLEPHEGKVQHVYDVKYVPSRTVRY